MKKAAPATAKRKPAPNRTGILLGVRIKPELRDALVAAAAKEQRTLGNLVSLLLAQGLDALAHDPAAVTRAALETQEQLKAATQADVERAAAASRRAK